MRCYTPITKLESNDSERSSMTQHQKIILWSMVGILFALLAACQPRGTIRVIVPNGSPAFAQLMVEAGEVSLTQSIIEVDRVSGAEPLIAAFGSASHEFIFAPTNVAARLILSGAPYRFVAAVNFGNGYLVSQSPLSSLEDLAGLEIVAFGQMATPDIVLRALLRDVFDPLPMITYVPSVQEAIPFTTQENTAVLLAEPLVSVALTQNPKLYVLDVQALWETTFGEAGYVQAGLFVHESVSRSVIDDYLDALITGVSLMIEEPARASALALTLDYPFPEAVMTQAIPRSNIRIVPAQQARANLEAYFHVILSLNPNLIGGVLPPDDFYDAP